MRTRRSFGSAAHWSMMLAALAGTTLGAAREAKAADGVGTSSSVGSVALHYEETKGMPTSIETGYIGPSFAKINVGIDIDPVIDGGPLYEIDMPKGAQILASWGNDKNIVLKAQNGSTSDGLVTVRHTLTPRINFMFDGFGLNSVFKYDATDLLSRIPGSRFDYDAKATQRFAPWGLVSTAETTVFPDLTNSVLFSMDMEALPDFVSNNVTGSFGIKATTNPTFSYKTTKISFAGSRTPITSRTLETTVPAIDGNFMDVAVAVEGEMSVKGQLSLQPFVHIDTIMNQYNLNADFNIKLMNFDYSVPPQKVNFKTVVVRIPMPNVRVPPAGVDIGGVEAGKSKSKTVTIENTGEKEALMKFTTSNTKFSVPSELVTVPAKSKYDLNVTFTSDGSGAASADITVLSSDPDSPEQTFKIGANGAEVGGTGSSDDPLAPRKAADQGGCGCSTVGTSSSVSGWAGLSLAGLGAAVLFRRRRKAA